MSSRIFSVQLLYWFDSVGKVSHVNNYTLTVVYQFNNKIESFQLLDGKRGPGRPKMTWKRLTERDCREWKLSGIDPHHRDTWRSGVKPAMHAASQLLGRGPTDVDIAPVLARYSKIR